MSTTERHTEALSSECEELLAGEELYSLGDHKASDYADIYTLDGEFVANVTATITPHDLRALIAYGRHQLQEGQRIGKENLQGHLVSLLGLRSVADGIVRN